MTYRRGSTAIFPPELTSSPAMELRVFDLWDELDGRITRGFAGKSLVWPFALYADDRPPPIAQLYLAACNASDPASRNNTCNGRGAYRYHS